MTPNLYLVWETLTGPDTGTYIVGRVNQHWSDFDKPPIPDQADLEEYQKVVGNYVESGDRYVLRGDAEGQQSSEFRHGSQVRRGRTFHVR